MNDGEQHNGCSRDGLSQVLPPYFVYGREADKELIYYKGHNKELKPTDAETTTWQRNVPKELLKNNGMSNVYFQLQT